jgi:hypothetical protein
MIGPRSNNQIAFDEAWLYCATLAHNGKYDWRFPTEDEYMNHSAIKLDDFSGGDHVYQLNYVTPVRDVN